MKQLEVQIMGQTYLLGCPEGGDSHLLDAVERVDTAMCKIRDSGKIRARDRIAVLAALNLAFDLADRTQATGHLAASSAPSTAEPDAAMLATLLPRNEPVLTSLLERLDMALASDGRLL